MNKQSRGAGCLLLILLVAFAAAVSATAPAQVARQSEPVATTIYRLATEYPEEVLKAVLDAVDGVMQVDTAMVTLGPTMYAEIVISPNESRMQIADRLRQALAIDNVQEYVFILNNGYTAAEYVYRDDQWQITILAITPAASSTPRPTQTPAQNDYNVTPAANRDYWAINNINVRECPGTTCSIVGTVRQGTRLTVNGRADGEAVNSGNRVWYQVQYGDETAFVYSSLLTDRAPAPAAPTTAPQVQQNAPPAAPEQPAQSVQPTQPPPPPAAPAGARPKNCATAVAMGLNAVQAAQWSHLDRDKDGVACYGD